MGLGGAGQGNDHPSGMAVHEARHQAEVGGDRLARADVSDRALDELAHGALAVDTVERADHARIARELEETVVVDLKSVGQATGARIQSDRRAEPRRLAEPWHP